MEAHLWQACTPDRPRELLGHVVGDERPTDVVGEDVASACQKPAGQRDCLTAWRRRCYRHRPDRWGPINATQLLSTWTYTLSFGNLDFGQGAAVGTIMMLVSLVCALAYVRSHRRELRR
jgi:hypothetical protein